MARPLGKRLKSAKTERSELRAMVLSIDSHEADRRHGPGRSGQYAAPLGTKGTWDATMLPLFASNYGREMCEEKPRRLR